jgi:hypothetical protein
MGIKISKDRLLSQIDSKTRAEYLKNEIRSNKCEPVDILNFKHYFSGFKLIEGIHGPEEVNSKIYLSVFHFMEYDGINPHDFDTISIGGHLSTLTSDYQFCVYSDFPHKINKYEYNFLIKNKSVFSNYQKVN